ncbi:hypothetical protein CRM90_27995 [Mycobacterium sp. ENV421]|uniref:hypothetical protein n=1 Tax=Mycobacterium sp. ENV421 TaxID=1213407 RepID=UPI000C99FDAE|nr:hypothetical protein [Mycobacterium sp. ENV421]PND54444.1 hypothetical protein CRM90_27995 [Mycobacterium sp. ENV421]
MSILDDLLDAVSAAPCLPGARCRGHHSIFDPAAQGEDPEVVAARHAQAIGLCGRCESLDRCEAWFLGLPKRQRPQGVIAGRLHNPKTVGQPADTNRRESLA